jgi:hypothetical protein
MTEVVKINRNTGIIDTIIEAEKLIVFPSYLLRWVPYVGVHEVVLRIVLEQLFFLRCKDKSQVSLSRFQQNHQVSTRYIDIERWSGLSRISVIRHLESSTLIKKTVCGQGVIDGRNQQLPNQYDLPPLQFTPGDASDLFNFVKNKHTEGVPVEEVLAALKNLSISDFSTEKPYRLPHKDDVFSTVENADLLSIISTVYGAVPQECLGDIRKIEYDLINAIHSYITVPWYFFLDILPVVGLHNLVAYLMCLPLIFEDRRSFKLEGGAKTIAAWVDKRTIYRTFPRDELPIRKDADEHPLTSRDLDKQAMRILFENVETAPGVGSFNVYLSRNPILSHHRIAIDALQRVNKENLSLLGKFSQDPQSLRQDEDVFRAVLALMIDIFSQMNTCELGLLERLIKFKNIYPSNNGLFDTLNFENVVPFDTLNSRNSGSFDTLKLQIHVLFDTLNFQNDGFFDTLKSEKRGLFDTLLKILKLLKIPQIINRYLPPELEEDLLTSDKTSEFTEEGGRSLQDCLLTYVDQKVPNDKRENVVIWFLEGLQRPTVNSHAGFAYAKAIQEKIPPPGRFREMINLSLAEVQKALDGYGSHWDLFSDWKPAARSQLKKYLDGFDTEEEKGSGQTQDIDKIDQVITKEFDHPENAFEPVEPILFAKFTDLMRAAIGDRIYKNFFGNSIGLASRNGVVAVVTINSFGVVEYKDIILRILNNLIEGKQVEFIEDPKLVERCRMDCSRGD